MSGAAATEAKAKPLGFWACWSLTVGVMIGSGIFTLPALLAPYGMVSYGGWLIAGGGSILLALVFARLAARTPRSGGAYVWTRDAFGDFPGFLMGWGYWVSGAVGAAAIAVAFVGYLPVFVPGLANAPVAQMLCGLGLIWGLTLIALRGAGEAGFVQILLTALKLLPLLAVIGLGVAVGSPANLPEFNPKGDALLPLMMTTALLTTWAFSGLETGALPAGDIRDPQRTIPRALVAGTLVVTVVYLAATYAVMMLVPAEVLATSTAPFADAAVAFGPWGPPMIAIGALISTAGALNGTIFISGQTPMAVALDRLAPAWLGHKNAVGAPVFALLLSSGFASLLLFFNYTRGLIAAFEFLLMMSTTTALFALTAGVLADLRHAWPREKPWAAVAALAAIYAVFCIVGATFEVIAWGGVLIAIGAPLYWFGKQKAA